MLISRLVCGAVLLCSVATYVACIFLDKVLTSQQTETLGAMAFFGGLGLLLVTFFGDDL